MDYMDVFAVTLSVFSLILAVATLTFVAYDCMRRKDELALIETAGENLKKTTELLGETHNAIVKAQKSIFDRLEVLDTRTTSLATQMTPQSRRM